MAIGVGDYHPYYHRLPRTFDPSGPWQEYYPVQKNVAVPTLEPVQDGLLSYYNAMAPQADANVERRLETEPYEWPYGHKPHGSL